MSGSPARAAQGSTDAYQAVAERRRITENFEAMHERRWQVRAATVSIHDDVDRLAKNEAAQHRSSDDRHLEMTAEELARERARAARSLARSHAVLRATLSLPCPQCGAARGSYCLPSVHAFCRPRFEKAQAGATGY